MDTLADKAAAILEKLGQAFLIAGYLPAALFIAANQIFLLPRWLGHPVTLLQVDPAQMPAQWIYLIDQGITLLLLPLLLGVVLMALNTTVIKLYEGSLIWQRKLLLLPWQRRNERRAKQIYGDLVVIKKAYNETLAGLAAQPNGTDRVSLEQRRASLALEIQRTHSAIAERVPVQRLPRRVDMVKPTALGNAFAVIEEYPYERYGMDGVLYWPRLRPLLDAPYAAALTNTKMILDLLLNLSLLSMAFGLEAVSLGIWGGLDWTLILSGIGGWILSYVCYLCAVTTVHSLGDTISLCFDLHRGKLWKQFGFPPPKDLEQEQAVWLQLAQFLQRGEGFYFPSIAAHAQADHSGSEEDTESST